MIDYISSFNPITQALLATLFTWGVTSLGAGIVVFTKRVSPLLMDTSLGFAGGVMIAASYWSLLAPAIEMAEEAGTIPWLPAAVGFLGGALFMRLVDMVCLTCIWGFPPAKPRGLKRHGSGRRCWSWPSPCTTSPKDWPWGSPSVQLLTASDRPPWGPPWPLAIGIGLQNFPEGMAVSLPLRREGMSRIKALWYGQFIRHGGAGGRRAGGGGGHGFLPDASLCPCFCRRRHDFCGDRRGDSRIPAGQ